MHLKKLVLASLLTTAAAGYSTGAMAAQSPEDTLYDQVSNGGYVQLSAGLGSPSSDDPAADLGSGLNVNIALGWEWDVAPDFRVELEYGRYTPDSTGGDTTVQSVAGNAIMDIPLNGRFPQWEWYIGMGAGWAQASVEDAGDATGWMWQVMTGLSLELEKHWTFFGGYRFRRYGDFGSTLEASIIEAGVRYGF